ncbi:MAG TPA: alpha/beta hydrolase [Dehalococcoidia bacterium]|nr:alpha/beta hydrolase [Dehalococcoidia bacterium]
MLERQSGRVTIETGVVFGTGGGRELRCDVYRPPEGTSNGCGVLLIHGGGWMQGDRTQLRGYGILLGRKGYTCVACEYRLSGEAKWPAQLHDVKAALRWMRANARTLAIDPGKIAVEGNSAGGHLALMLGATPNAPEFEGDGGHPGVSTEVAAVIAFYAPALLGASGLPLSGPVAALMGPGATHDDVLRASPVTYARREFPPTQLFHGTKDELVPVSESLRMFEALRDAGARVELHAYEGAPHAFDALPDFGRQCAEIMALFLDRHVVNPRPVSLPQPATA